MRNRNRLSPLHPRFSRSMGWPDVNYADIRSEVHIKHICTGREGHLSVSSCRAYGNQMASVAKSQRKVLPSLRPPCGARKARRFSLSGNQKGSASFLSRGRRRRRSAAFAPDWGGNGRAGIPLEGKNSVLSRPLNTGGKARQNILTCTHEGGRGRFWIGPGAKVSRGAAEIHAVASARGLHEPYKLCNPY